MSSPVARSKVGSSEPAAHPSVDVVRQSVHTSLYLRERIDVERSAFSPCADFGNGADLGIGATATNLDADCGQFPPFGNIPITPGVFIPKGGGRRHH